MQRGHPTKQSLLEFEARMEIDGKKLARSHVVLSAAKSIKLPTSNKADKYRETAFESSGK